jgi:adenylate cyclase
MAEERVQRRLAAILAADVVGYSRLMEQDEAGTLAVLKGRRKEVLKPLVARHQGRIFKFTGDGVLVEFGSAVNAVQCAIDLQNGMAAANAALPEDRRIVLRIGINLGDVMIEGSDLYGDGINIAARLEAVAEPGGILISGTVYDYIRNKVNAGFEDLGPQSLKNISEPIRAYRVTGIPAVAVPKTKSAAAKPAIAVLPFANLSGDRDQEYFSDGITEDIITELSRFRELLVMARNSTFVYKGRAIDVREIGRELAVQYVVEGSVRRSVSRVRVTAQLVEAITGNHLWADRYDRDLSDIFSVQDEVVRTIVGTIVGRLETAGVERAQRKPTNNLAAYDCVLRARAEVQAAYDPTIYAESGMTRVRSLIQQAIALDPQYARAYAVLAFASFVDWFYLGNEADIEQAYANAEKSVALDPDDGRSRSILGRACMFSKRHSRALIHFERALEINPNDPEAINAMGVYLDLSGRHDEAIEIFRKVLKLNPVQRDLYMEDLGFANYAAGHYQEAADAFSEIVNRPHWTHAHLAASYAKLGQLDEARAEVKQLEPWPAPWDKPGAATDPEFPRVPKALIAYIKCYKDEEVFRNWIDGFRKAGLPV